MVKIDKNNLKIAGVFLGFKFSDSCPPKLFQRYGHRVQAWRPDSTDTICY